MLLSYRARVEAGAVGSAGASPVMTGPEACRAPRLMQARVPDRDTRLRRTPPETKKTLARSGIFVSHNARDKARGEVLCNCKIKVPYPTYTPSSAQPGKVGALIAWETHVVWHFHVFWVPVEQEIMLFLNIQPPKPGHPSTGDPQAAEGWACSGPLTARNIPGPLEAWLSDFLEFSPPPPPPATNQARHSTRELIPGCVGSFWMPRRGCQERPLGAKLLSGWPTGATSRLLCRSSVQDLYAVKPGAVSGVDGQKAWLKTAWRLQTAQLPTASTRPPQPSSGCGCGSDSQSVFH